VQFIADLGADVIKIEPPGGTLWERNWAGSDLYLNGVSAFFLSTHRNQRSLTLDLKHPDGRAIARRLVEGADVLVQNFRPGVMERLGLGWETVREWNPRLVYVSASGYGESSPYRDRPGQDLLLQALSGLASISAGPVSRRRPWARPWSISTARRSSRWGCWPRSSSGRAPGRGFTSR
jgi:crotonobetainyl-CoA:carnitine CoA-transferase CaiB-like acyl-CoA transferase